MKIDPILLLDAYKLDHRSQYTEGTEYIYSNFTPRKFRDSSIPGAIFFGLQYFIKEYLLDQFNNNFFWRPIDEIMSTYKRRVNNFIGNGAITYDHIVELHDLGYLPIKIKALPEGTLVPAGVPMFTIINTNPRFFWLTNMLETIISNIVWLPCTSATTAFQFRRNFERYANITGASKEFVKWQGHDFSFRGMKGVESALMSGAAHLLSFTGSDTVPAVDFLEEYYNADSDKELIAMSVSACYDDQTEILTNKGFKFFAHLQNNDLVAQYHEDGSINFVKPLEYFYDAFSGKMIHFTKSGYNYFDTMVTPNHKMVRKDKNNHIQIFEAESKGYRFRNGYSDRNSMIVAGQAVGDGISSYELSGIDKLRIAFQADGSFPSHSEDYTGDRSGTFPIRFSLKKDRKADRLVSILNLAGIKYTVNKYDNGYYSFWINSPVEQFKDFSWVDLTAINYHWSKAFIEELQFWDGHKSSKNTITYSSTNKECVEIVQAIGCLSGYKTQWNEYTDHREDCSRKTIYTVTFTLNKNSVTGAGVKKEYIDYDGIVYCVSVPTHMLITRRNHVIAISGNTEHSVMSIGSKENELETYRRLITEVYPKGIVSIVSDTYDFFNVLTNIAVELKEEIMNRDGKLVFRPDSGFPPYIICGNPHSVDNSPEYKGATELLWEIFGGTINVNGYKELDQHVGLIYGDGINLKVQQEMLEGLERNGFASSNILMGIGSFSYSMVSRDNLGFAMKATWGKTSHDDGVAIFKDPKTDNGTKKSHKGLLSVVREDGILVCKQECTSEQEEQGELRTVFINGKLLIDQSLATIRERLEAQL